MNLKRLAVMVGVLALAIGIAVALVKCDGRVEQKIEKKLEKLTKEDSIKSFNAAKYADTALYYIGVARDNLEKRDSILGDSSRLRVEIESFESKVRGDVERNYYGKLAADSTK